MSILVFRRPRDSQRGRVWRALNSLREYRINDLGPRPSVDDVQRFVDGVLADPLVGRHFGESSIAVSHSQGRSGGSGGFGVIRVSTRCRQKMFVLQLIAYNLVGLNAGHGPEFCAAFLVLVRRAMGRAVEQRVREAFKANRVRFRPKRKRAPLSPERREELIARLARYRAERRSTNQA